MYKRRARILFLHPHRLDSVWLLANTERLAGGWLQARAVCMSGTEELAQDDVAWADLIVALDEGACEGLAMDQWGAPHRCWRLPAASAELEGWFEQRLRSMVGGMKMLQGNRY